MSFALETSGTRRSHMLSFSAAAFPRIDSQLRVALQPRVPVQFSTLSEVFAIVRASVFAPTVAYSTAFTVRFNGELEWGART